MVLLNRSEIYAAFTFVFPNAYAASPKSRPCWDKAPTGRQPTLHNLRHFTAILCSISCAAPLRHAFHVPHAKRPATAVGLLLTHIALLLTHPWLYPGVEPGAGLQTQQADLPLGDRA
jgi:hypothetical protein